MEKQPEQSPKKKVKLTKKQRIFVKEYALTENGAQSALKAYNIKTRNNTLVVASGIANENLNKPYIAEAVEETRLTLKEALYNQGITPEKIGEKVGLLLESDDENSVNNGLKHATNIYGVADVDKPKTSGNIYNFIFSSEAQDKIKSVEGEIKNLLKQKHDQKN